jgi:hypothetical protein
MNWFGWLWTGSRWERVSGPHETLSACSKALASIGQERGVPERLQVMTGGGVPQMAPRTPNKEQP